MVAKFKVTRIELGTVPATAGGRIGVKVEYVDPTTVPPTPGTIVGEVSSGDAEDTTALKTGIEDIFTNASLDTPNWTI